MQFTFTSKCPLTEAKGPPEEGLGIKQSLYFVSNSMTFRCDYKDCGIVVWTLSLARQIVKVEKCIKGRCCRASRLSWDPFSGSVKPRPDLLLAALS